MVSDLHSALKVTPPSILPLHGGLQEGISKFNFVEQNDLVACGSLKCKHVLYGTEKTAHLDRYSEFLLKFAWNRLGTLLAKFNLATDRAIELFVIVSVIHFCGENLLFTFRESESEWTNPVSGHGQIQGTIA